MAKESDIETMRRNYLNGGYGYGHAKLALFECFMDVFAEPRRIFNYYMENTEELEGILVEGEAKAREIAQETIGKVRKVLGFSS